jgi:hypothetical protein
MHEKRHKSHKSTAKLTQTRANKLYSLFDRNTRPTTIRFFVLVNEKNRKLVRVPHFLA